MATKLSELVNTIGPGARTNKYRILFPYMGREIDIQSSEVTLPGRSIGVVDVYLKGREYKVAGDRGDSGSATVTIYNDPGLVLRNFFLRTIEGIQSYETPITIDASRIGDYTGIIGTIPGFDIVDSIFNGGIDVIDYYYQLEYNLTNLGNFLSGIEGNEMYPAYQTDIIIQQLDENEKVVSETTLYNAFISEVSDIEYVDETGDISKTTITITYSGNRIRDIAMN